MPEVVAADVEHRRLPGNQPCVLVARIVRDMTGQRVVRRAGGDEASVCTSSCSIANSIYPGVLPGGTNGFVAHGRAPGGAPRRYIAPT